MSSRANYYAKTLSVCPNGEMVTRSEKFVLMVLADAHQDGAHLRTYPKVATIAEDAMVSERQCQRIFASLERKGVLRREYPNGVGRDRLTFYFFPELDEQGAALPAVKKPARKAVKMPVGKPEIESNKGDILTPLFQQEGCQKGDIRVTSGAPHLITNNKSNKSKNKYTPLPPDSGGECANLDLNFQQGERTQASAVTHPVPGLGKDLPSSAVNRPAPRPGIEPAIDQVMHACGFAIKRFRRVLREAIQIRLDVGDEAPTVALAMIAAWKMQAEECEREVLRAHFGPDKFFGNGIWRTPELWYWDVEKLARQREARVGM